MQNLVEQPHRAKSSDGARPPLPKTKAFAPRTLRPVMGEVFLCPVIGSGSIRPP
jgi:hypothetical protein